MTDIIFTSVWVSERLADVSPPALAIQWRGPWPLQCSVPGAQMKLGSPTKQPAIGVQGIMMME